MVGITQRRINNRQRERAIRGIGIRLDCASDFEGLTISSKQPTTLELIGSGNAAYLIKLPLATDYERTGATVAGPFVATGRHSAGRSGENQSHARS